METGMGLGFATMLEIGSMMANGKMGRNMDLADTHILTDQCLKGSL